MPPPSDVAWSERILQEETVSVPWLAIPPPSAAEFPLTVQFVRGLPYSRMLKGRRPLTVQLPLK